jgi:phosphoglycolate phosphatase
MPPRFDLAVLDLDGTLVDSRDILVGLVNETLVACAHAAAPPDTIAASIGLPLEVVFQRAAPAADPGAIAVLCAAYRRDADALEFVRRFRLFDGAATALARLRAAGTRLVVGTSKGRATSLDILQHCGVDALIDEVIGGDCVQRGKPHPEMVLRALERYRVDPARAVVVGDTTFDIDMGHAAGAATCAVTYGMHTADALRSLRPHFIVDRVEQLAPALT